MPASPLGAAGHPEGARESASGQEAATAVAGPFGRSFTTLRQAQGPPFDRLRDHPSRAFAASDCPFDELKDHPLLGAIRWR